MTTVVVTAARTVTGPGTIATAKRAGRTIPNAQHAAACPARDRVRVRGWTPIGPAGMSAVTPASSAYVRAAKARLTRRSNSSLVSRPCTNAALSTSITCSRSACDARRQLPPPARFVTRLSITIPRSRSI